MCPHTSLPLPLPLPLPPLYKGRLGPGRLHHCMRLVGAGERAIELMVSRALSRHAFGGPLADQGALRSVLATARCVEGGVTLLDAVALWHWLTLVVVVGLWMSPFSLRKTHQGKCESWLWGRRSNVWRCSVYLYLQRTVSALSVSQSGQTSACACDEHQQVF